MGVSVTSWAITQRENVFCQQKVYKAFVCNIMVGIGLKSFVSPHPNRGYGNYSQCCLKNFLHKIYLFFLLAIRFFAWKG